MIRNSINYQSSTVQRLVRLALVLVFLAFGAGEIRAQYTGAEATPTPSVPSLKPSTPQKSSVSVNSEAMIFDGSIDPKEYRMGPGDLMELHLWASGEVYQVNVSPDERIVVPHVGEFEAHGKTLDSLRNEIDQKAFAIFKTPKTINNGDPISLSLLQPRRIYVTVKGDVSFPNVYTFSAGTRANIAIEYANRPQQQQSPLFADEARLRDIEQKKREAEHLRPYFGANDEKTLSERYVMVIHSDGKTDRVDLLRFAGTRDSKYCPLLREGDQIYVPYKNLLEGQIGVWGAVISPGAYEFVEGDSLAAMLKNVFGTTATADLKHVELTRTSLTGADFHNLYYDVTAIATGKMLDIPLQRGDRIFVRDSVDIRELSKVLVTGELRNPGVYPIQREVTKLSWVIKNAGGFTPYAFLRGCSVTRRRLDLETKDITPADDALEVTRLANLSVSDTANFKLQTSLRSGVATVDLYRLFKLGDSSADLTLRDGDVVSIPSSPNDVYVWGYVGREGRLPWVEGASIQHYIDLAGGYAEGAVKDGTRVIKAGTRQYLEPSATRIEPGDEIYVPKTPDHSENYTLSTIGAIAGIVSGVVGTVLAILYFTKK